MSADRDMTRIVRSWLRTDEHESADRILDNVLAQLDATPQRRSWWPAWRIADMNNIAKLAIAAAAVVVVAVVGLNLLPSPGVGGPSTTPSPSSSPAATTSPAPDSLSEIEPGSYVISTSQMRAHLTMPAGWYGGETSIGLFPPVGWTGSLGLELTPFDVSNVVTDACADEADINIVEVGPTVEDLTNALASQAGIQRSGPTDVMVGGYPAKKFVLTLLLECPGPHGHGIWADATRTYGFWLGHGETGTVYVVDVNGDRLVITSQYGARASAEDITQLEAITASIDIEPLASPEPLPGIGPGGWLPIGRHALTVDGVPLSFSVPALVQDRGWARYRSLYISKDTVGSQGAEAVIYWTGFPDGVDTDLCPNVLSPSVGPSAADLAAAMATAPGTELISGPTDVTVGGRAAKHAVLTVREDLGCDPGFFFTWEPASGGPGWWTTNVGDTIRVWIVDVDGSRLVIAGETTEQASRNLEQEIQQIVDSIQFE